MPEGEPSLLRTENGQSAVWKGVNLYPASDPIEYARRKARIFSILPGTLVFVPSIGLGYGLEDLLARLPPDCAVICIEAHQPLMALAMRQGLPSDPRLFILRTDSEQAAALTLQKIGTRRFRRVVEISLCAGYRLAPAVYAGMRRALEDQVREYWRNRLTLIALGSLQVRNLLSNLALLPRAGDLSHVSTSMPVVVVGAGPSLGEIFPTLRSVRKDIILMAVDTALPRLAAESLPPDIVVALEAQVFNLLDFLPRPDPSILIACEMSCHPTVPRLFDGRVRFFSSEFAPLRLFTRMAGAGMLPCPFPALGSVGVAAVKAALGLTTGEIFLAGLDFSYPGSLTHAGGTPHHLAALAAAARLEPVEGSSFRAIEARRPSVLEDKTGKPVLTDAVLTSYRDSLRRLIAGAGGRVHDACSTGLDLGAAQITGRKMKEKVSAARARGIPPDRAAAPVCSVDAARAFLASEEELLRRGDELLDAAVRSGTASPECSAFLEEADYVWVHFPDEPAQGGPDRGFLARVRVGVRYYAERLGRLASLL